MGATPELYRQIVTAVPEGIWVVNPQGRTIFCNERMADLLGTDVESLERLSCFDPIFPEDFEEAQRRFGLQLGGGGQPFDFRLRRMDGSAIWVSISCKPMYDAGGGCIGLVGLFADISKRRQAERELRDSEKLFRAIFTQAGVGIAQAGLDGAWLMVNDRLCEMLGYTQAELRTKTFLDITHPDDRDASFVAIRQLLSGEISSWMTEKRYVRKYGNTIWGRLFVSLVRDQNHEPQYFISVVEEVTDRIQAERAFQETQQQLKLALSAGLGVWECDLRKREVSMSPQYRKAFGHAPLSYDAWMQLIHPNDQERVRAVARAGIEQARGWEAEFRVLWPDGRERWMLSKATVLLDDEQRPARMVGVSLDITERKRAEEQRSHLAAIVESSAIAIIGETLDGTITSWNSGAQSLYGYSEEEVIGRHISLLIPPARQDRIPEVLERLRRGERIQRFETTRLRKDGQLVPVSLNLSPIRNSAGAVVGISAMGRDISTQKQAESELRESEERFRRIFEEGPLGLALIANDYRFLKVNGALCQMLGYPEAELLQLSFPDITHPEDLGANVELSKRLFNGEIPVYQLQKRYVKKNGETIWVKLTASVLHDEEGMPLQGLGMIEDISEIKRSQEEALARQKLESLGVLAGGIAHDFNNLLGGILAAELAETDLATGLTPSEEIERIKKVAIRGAEIVRELMIFAGQDQTALVEAVDLSQLVDEILELLKVSISKHAVLRATRGKNLPAVRGNAAQIRQVVMNLVINASEAIGETEGTINVTTSQVSGRAENAAALPAGEYVRLEVSDSGCGMTETVKAKMFDPFFSTKFAGRGLGLAVVQGIVRAHSGAIHLTSAPGEGTTFQVYWPCCQRGVEEPVDVITQPLAPQSGSRVSTILIVEDEETLRLAVSKSLRRRGFSVMEASNGFEAMHVLDSHKQEINGVLLDLTIPGTSSREIFCKILEMRPDLKVIVTSAYSKESVDAFFGGLRVDYFIRKPFQLGDLARLLEDIR